MQEQILDRNPSLKVKVYAIWFEMILTDRRSFWPKGIFKDARVTEFWDGDKALGTWYGRQLRPDDQGVVLWDTYLLYEPGARWNEMPPRLVSWGGTVVQEIHHLETDLLAAAGKPGGGTEGDTGSPSGTGSRPRAGESTVTLKVSGMTCGGCEAAIRMALKKLDGVVSVHVDSTRGTATVAFLEATVTIEKIVEAIDQTGFKASLAQAPAGS